MAARAGSKDTRNLIRAIERAGGHVAMTGKQHWKVYLGDRLIVTMSGTPSDNRARRNAVADLRRNGLGINY